MGTSFVVRAGLAGNGISLESAARPGRYLVVVDGTAEVRTRGGRAGFAGRATWRQLMRLWGTVLVMNLAGGWVFTWLVMRAYPELDTVAISTGAHYVNGGFTLRTFCLALLAGGAITLMTRMHHGTTSVPAKIVASVAAGFVLAGLRLWHSVLDSLLAFAGLHTCHAPYGYLDWLAWLGWAVLGNVVGGLGLTTLLRLVRSTPLLAEHRNGTADVEEEGSG